MKKVKYFLFMSLLFFSYISSSKAYVRVNASFGTFDPVQDSSVNSGTISNVWSNGTYPVLENQPWLLSYDQFFYLGSANGTYLNVNADYYVAFNTPAAYTSYLNTARSTLTSSNLRCGIGGYRTGYDSSYIPEISNFEVTEVSSSPAGGFGTNYLYHIKFNYSQQIRKVLLNNQNASCWFEIPTNYLVGQLKGSNLTYNVAFWSNTVNLQSAVSDDPLASYLGDITNQNNTIIDQNNQTNNKLDNISNQNTEAEKTRKGIWQTLKDLPGTIINGLLDMLKSLFIPSDDFFQNFINDFKDNFLEKLGFLAYPFELIGDILGRYMNIATDPVINIPNIHEPFTGGLLIAATSVNLKEIFEHGAIGTMYGIYRSFVSVIIIFMFLNFAMRKYDEFVKNRGSGS